ncbi:amidohydrolase [Sulfolobus sp. A20]|uniref:nitrilase-related carbon-nitrogen hydrolase n=1 Tax=Sulfolobaceae TaxID=118883 RepID=UPI0008460F5A|nr:MULTISPECIES: nitrilase-related carbon-nitrogen hydrolase [unclassified Sulfolobus]TRM77514.1 amidohydrolase [Sulfolobus sp. A20-N-F8]TRM79327.1 amidohydrolase [Sulfolobus sp. B5]TRM82995.1 amidohydrolase [Sulfolobus sp. A20-N-F6]TRM89423.1 amidohydrolase [Sulfolobus sp. C3]AOL17041.1 amidohydrolase [Sulfolobus sp. A20]
MGITVELAQIRSYLGNINKNFDKHIEIIETSTADCIVFPELSLTGYILKDLTYEVYKEAMKVTEKIAEKVSKCAIFGTLKEMRKGIIRNSAAVVINGKLDYVYKFYLPTYGLFEERRYFQRGDPLKDLKVFEYKGTRFGVVICEDAWHPEPIEAIALLGADAIFIPSASPMRKLSERLMIEDNWDALLKAHSLMNTVWSVFVNVVGSQEEEYFWGGSRVISPLGETKLKLKLFYEDRGVVEITDNEIERARFFSSYRDHIKEFHSILDKL